MTGYMLNGRFVPEKTLAVDPDEPFLAHGFGLFETLRSHHGRACFVRPHVRRMERSAAEIGLDWPMPAARIEEAIAELLVRRELVEARVRLALLGRRDGSSDLVITAEETAPLPRVFERIAIGAAAPRFQERALAGMKTINYLVNRLAEQEAAARGFDEAIFLLPDGTVCEGSRSTVFAVFDGELVTPPLDLPILPGIVRRVVLELARREGLPVAERRFTLDELLEADEAFVTGSVSCFRPVRRIEDRELPQPAGPVFRAVSEAYRALVASSSDLDAFEPRLERPGVLGGRP